jgi:hypothetical protein
MMWLAGARAAHICTYAGMYRPRQLAQSGREMTGAGRTTRLATNYEGQETAWMSDFMMTYLEILSCPATNSPVRNQ